MSTLALNAQLCTIRVPFHGRELYVVNHNGEPYTPMKPIVEGMGMDWASQFIKLKQRFKTCVVNITMQIPGDDQRRDVTCLALRKLSAWLNTISPNKVKPEIRDTVIHYQEECDDVLYEYWTKGVAVNPRKVKPAAAGKITIDQQEAIKQLVISRGKSLPKQHQAKAMITMWSSLKSHFSCSYKDIAEEHFAEALSIAARVPLEGELMPVSSTPATYPPFSDDYANRTELIYYHDFKPIFCRVLRGDEMVTNPESIKEWMEMRGLIFFTRDELKAMTHVEWLAMIG